VVDIIYGEGISKEGEIVDLGVEHGLIQKTGNWYMISGEKIGNGREAAKAYIKSHPEVEKDFSGKLHDILKGAPAETPAAMIMAKSKSKTRAKPSRPPNTIQKKKRFPKEGKGPLFFLFF
jgi:hypothetical protein